MKFKTLSEIQSMELDQVAPAKPDAVRRRRLERFANLLECHSGPLRLFSQIEAIPGRRLRAMRRDSSPFSIAFVDPVFRAEGLASDTIGDASTFFGLSSSETHELVCDCHYFGPVNARIVAERARYLAAHPSLISRIRNLVAGMTAWRATR